MPEPVPGSARKHRRTRVRAGTGEEARAPQSASKRFPGRVRKPLTWLTTKVAGAVLAAAVGTGFTVWVIERPDSLATQIDGIKAEQNKQGRQVALEKQADLHGTDTKSYVFLFKDEAIGQPELSASDPGQRSDLLRIYDYKPSGVFQRRKLVERFSFAPSGQPNQLIFDSIKDWDRDERPELVGSYWGLSEDVSASVPVFVRWDPSGRYRIFAILSRRELLPPIPDDPYRLAYLQRRRLVDKQTGVSVRGYAVEFPRVVRVGDEAVLIGGYALERPDFVPRAYRVHAWSLDFRRSRPVIERCFFGDSTSSEDHGGLTVDVTKTKRRRLVEYVQQTVQRQAERLYC